MLVKHAISGKQNEAIERQNRRLPVANTKTALNWMAVDPSHRHRGIGCLLMDVGVVRADELDLECWLEASEMGKPLYEKFGYHSLLKVAFDNEKPNASDEWRRCAHEMTPPPIFAMWRPRKSVHAGSQGELRMPWSLGTER